MSPANRNGIIYSSLIYVSFISFSLTFFFFCHISLARTFSTMLNKISEGGHSCLIFNLRKKAFSLSLLIIMLAVEF